MYISGYMFTCPHTCTQYRVVLREYCGPQTLCEAPDMNTCVCEDSLGVRLVRVTTITTDSSRGYSSHNTSALHHILCTVHYMATMYM